MSWKVIKPQRYRGYGRPLYELLRSSWATGASKPTARDVVDAWSVKPPWEVIEATPEYIKFLSTEGNIRCADLRAIAKAIHRMTR